MNKIKESPFKKEQELLSYLKEGHLVESLPLVSSEALSFHWANWNESCLFQKEYLFDNAKSCERYFEFNQSLDEFKNIPVWMKNREKTIKSSLFDLYQCYSDNRIRMTWFERDNEILISMSQESGPYITLSSMRWMDKSIYSRFVMKKLLTQNMPMRGFRLSANIPAHCTFEGIPLKSSIFIIHQISEHGMVLKIKGLHHLNLIENCEKILMNVNLKPFLEVSNATVNETLKRLEQQDFFVLNPEQEKLTTLTIDPSILDKYDNRQNFRMAANDEFYLFVRYRDLTNESNSIRVKKVFKSLVLKFQHQFNEVIKKSA